MTSTAVLLFFLGAHFMAFPMADTAACQHAGQTLLLNAEKYTPIEPIILCVDQVSGIVFPVSEQ